MNGKLARLAQQEATGLNSGQTAECVSSGTVTRHTEVVHAAAVGDSRWKCDTTAKTKRKKKKTEKNRFKRAGSEKRR